MKRAGRVALLALLCAGCGAATSATKKPRCPGADQLWPVLEWSPHVTSEAVALLSRTVLEGWVRDRRSGEARPRILVAPISNLSSFQIERLTLQKPFEARLFESGAVALAPESSAPATLDGVIHIQIRDTLSIQGVARVSGFRFELAIAAPGVEPRMPDAPAWRRTVQITRTLKAGLRPPGCPEPTWFCPETKGRSLRTGCGVDWSCRNGRFSLACEPAANGKARCRCEGGDRPAKSFELPDLCKAESVEDEALRAANRECGWRLPMGR